MRRFTQRREGNGNEKNLENRMILNYKYFFEFNYSNISVNSFIELNCFKLSKSQNS